MSLSTLQCKIDNKRFNPAWQVLIYFTTISKCQNQSVSFQKSTLEQLRSQEKQSLKWKASLHLMIGVVLSHQTRATAASLPVFWILVKKSSSKDALKECMPPVVDEANDNELKTSLTSTIKNVEKNLQGWNYRYFWNAIRRTKIGQLMHSQTKPDKGVPTVHTCLILWQQNA